MRVDSFGASAQGRGLWMVTISDRSDSLAAVEGRLGPKRRVVAHARTHPWEVQAFHVARGMIRFLLDSTAEARSLRRDYVFHVIPQYNPDGVALERERTNANGVDLESDWDASSPQPEVAALRRLFQGFMAGPIPVEVALNLHSDQYNGKRFFVYHVEAGTSWIYTEEEKRFIAAVRARAPGAIQDWGFLTSWASGTATRYPEGWWWSNHRDSVLALTYEDDNSATGCCFDSTGRALVLGATDFLRGGSDAVPARVAGRSRLVVTGGGVMVRSGVAVDWSVVDPSGRVLNRGSMGSGGGVLSWNVLGDGMRVLVVRFPDGPETRFLTPRMR